MAEGKVAVMNVISDVFLGPYLSLLDVIEFGRGRDRGRVSSALGHAGPCRGRLALFSFQDCLIF